MLVHFLQLHGMRIACEQCPVFLSCKHMYASSNRNWFEHGSVTRFALEISMIVTLDCCSDLELRVYMTVWARKWYASALCVAARKFNIQALRVHQT